MTQDELNRRLLALNIAAVFLSSKAYQNVTLLSSIMFDERRKMPRNYQDHFSNICLPGLISDDQTDPIQEYDILRFGYHTVKCAQYSTLSEKSSHLNLSISFRFIHMITHAILLFLHELDELKDSNLPNRDYYRAHFEKDYELICQLSTDPDQCYLWLYKLINHLVDGNFQQDGFLNSYQKVMEFEKCIENKLIIPHIGSMVDEIQQYKIAYNRFSKQNKNYLTLYELVDELTNDETQYPLLSVFNITNTSIVDPINAFYAKLRIMPNADKLYPMTMFFLQRADDYSNISYLYPIITFVNYLIQKLNHRITRKNAMKKMMSEVLFNDSDRAIVKKLYNEFVEAWYKISFKEVHLDSQTIQFKREHSLQDFARRTELAKLLINSSKDVNSRLLIACLKTISTLQNDIVQYFHDIMSVNSINKKFQPQVVPLQTIQLKHLLCLDNDIISRKLIDDASIVNYDYGKGKDIIYDYEEIEFMLRDRISCLPLIDTERLNCFNYQFELYEASTSLVTEVRKNTEQKLLPDTKRNQLKKFIDNIPNDDILHYLGSLDHIFTYLRHCERKTIQGLTVKAFVENHIHSQVGLNVKLLQDSNFSTIELMHIVDFYQLLEEVAFEKILRNHIEQDSRGPLLIAVSQQNDPVDQFIDTTLEHTTIASCLKTFNSWINMLKRLLLRVSMNMNLSFDVPLQQYAGRFDLWTVDVTQTDIESFKICDSILLRHAWIILKGLEEKNTSRKTEQRSNESNQRPHTDRSSTTPQLWFPNQSTSRNQREVIGPNTKTNKKLRV